MWNVCNASSATSYSALSGTSVSAMRQFDTWMQNIWSANKYLSLKLKWNFWFYIFSWEACEEHSTRWSHPQPGRQNTLRHFNSKQKTFLNLAMNPYFYLFCTVKNCTAPPCGRPSGGWSVIRKTRPDIWRVGDNLVNYIAPIIVSGRLTWQKV